MNGLKLLTWLDVRRHIRSKTKYGTKLPDSLVKIRCFSDAVEIGIIHEDDLEEAKHTVKEWFGDWYLENESVIQLDMGDATLPVEFISGEETYITDIDVRPFWEEIAYLENNSEVEAVKVNAVKLPKAYTDKPSLIAFYSFKGGVGRTLNLAAYLFALLDRAKELNESINVLVIDADLEAPGLTYWNAFEKQQPAVSFMDFLEVYHYSPIEREETLSLFAREVKKNPKNEGRSTVYFLPACLDDQQLLDIPILPEHLVRSTDGVWEYGNALHRLGEVVGADYVFIDLRAGLSEISSPIIFDPRIKRFLVTTINEQSVRGTSLVLKQVGKVAPSEADVDDEIYYDPSLVINMLKEEFRKLPVYADALDTFRSDYNQPQEEDDIFSKRLEIKEAFFAEELLYVNNWEEARSKLKATSLMENAREWAEIQFLTTQSQELVSENTIKKEKPLLEAVIRLRNLCRRYEYAEIGEGEDLLITEPLQNLATNFRDKLPHVLSIGAKGAGKTFNYIQLSRFKYWETFLNYVDNKNYEPQLKKTYIFPLLESSNLQDNAKLVINEARNELKVALGENFIESGHSEYAGRIKKALNEQNWNELQWTEFWVGEIASAINVTPNTNILNNLSSIDHELKNKGLHIIFLFDGLEDIFRDIASSKQEQKALRALIDDLPKKLSEIRQSNLGIIIFLRRDFLKYTITQNLSQFENLYRSYDLSWDEDSFLRLVYWICSESQVINANKDNIYDFSKENLKDELENLWGKKLGSDKSNEAYTASWIFAALTDFNGRLQARDIVRFLYNAADITVNKANELQLEKWFISRLLPPKAIRLALKPCSNEKVKEAKEEYPLFKTWVEEKLPSLAEKKIPFAVEQFNMDQQTVRLLEEMGVIYEDKEKQEIARFYMPEIFREGLGFSGTGARPRILALKRKILGKGIL
ncbi:MULTISPECIES: ParA family protein [Cyanophyceae]|uniref:ParA family protein n=1 Tax=Cyanophyceae TaxID=3028117 RepID=UPI00232BDBB4|nr:MULTISPECIES: ParA family protein [Cyanophyceae]MDB9316104.1 ParA family protein [Nodularia spumigena CS-590/01A]MDB9320546.1 ParA family protein [Nodularia spumigena CS-591/07A]MDB9324762.1 ParA family protein [Nodularia spumigena CS-590/02]MDB9329247.1 ParA family protein [Nodularia spumigena CS-591/04]MDB9333608.1 ParA family protein [Nodularia spumigena CS-590/01]